MCIFPILGKWGRRFNWDFNGLVLPLHGGSFIFCLNSFKSLFQKKQKNMQPVLKPIKKEYQDYIDERNKAGLEAIELMSKQSLPFQEAMAYMGRLKAEMGKNKR